MKNSLVLLIFFSGSYLSFSQSNCTLRKDQDNIKVYTCNTDTSKFKSIKVECTINASLDQLEKILLDFPDYVRWQFNTVESRSLKKIDTAEFVYYAKIEAPWPVTDRDMVVHFRLIHTKDKMIVFANSEGGILAEKEGLVRVPASRSQWVVEEKNHRVEIKYAIQIDPGGSVPAWLMNWVCANAPLQSFKKLKLILEKN